jgi:hypothetical protein
VRVIPKEPLFFLETKREAEISDEDKRLKVSNVGMCEGVG